MDLGTLLGAVTDIGGQYVKYKYGGQALQSLQQPIAATPALFGGLPAVIPRVAPYIAGGLLGMGVDEWGRPKPKRRRRRRLATASDLRDLAALQGILGKGQAFTTWIATHGSH